PRGQWRPGAPRGSTPSPRARSPTSEGRSLPAPKPTGYLPGTAPGRLRSLQFSFILRRLDTQRPHRSRHVGVDLLGRKAASYEAPGRLPVDPRVLHPDVATRGLRGTGRKGCRLGQRIGFHTWNTFDLPNRCIGDSCCLSLGDPGSQPQPLERPGHRHPDSNVVQSHRSTTHQKTNARINKITNTISIGPPSLLVAALDALPGSRVLVVHVVVALLRWTHVCRPLFTCQLVTCGRRSTGTRG